MKLELTRSLVVFDLETTGVDVAKDRIVEMCFIKLSPNGERETLHEFVNPGIPIPLESSKIHGIYDTDVADKPSFKELSGTLKSFVHNCDFGGFNSNKFDFPLLCEEFGRAGVDFDSSKVKLVDGMRIFHQMEPRNLTAAYKYYCNKELSNAHSAKADTEATLDILLAQVEKYDEIGNNMEDLDKISRYANHVDFAGRFKKDENDVVVFNFGKHKGIPVKTVLEREPGYYDWMMKGDFPQNTKQVITKIRLESFGNK